MEIEREKIMALATEFMEENSELLDDPMIDEWVLARMLQQGAEIAVVFGKETEDIVNDAAAKARRAEGLYRDPNTPPKQLHAATLANTRVLGKAEAYRQALNEFADFMDRVKAAYYNLADVEIKEELERLDAEDAAEKAAVRESLAKPLQGPEGVDVQAEVDRMVEELRQPADYIREPVPEAERQGYIGRPQSGATSRPEPVDDYPAGGEPSKMDGTELPTKEDMKWWRRWLSQ